MWNTFLKSSIISIFFSKMNKASGARLHVSKSQERLVNFRVVFIMGTVKSTCLAFRLLSTQIRQHVYISPSEPSEMSKVLVPRDLVAYLIGKGGSVIKRIERSTSTRIQLINESAEGRSYEAYGRVVSICGSVTNCASAAYYLTRRVS